ncbi:MAG: DUF309 domain-containing protein [Verrucomicrobiae bacterium]|jgi:predicted metal-dependent hydrolase|nr:DUF309 domain-containing protein [Verrucomicrobiae bacterium]
MSHKSGKIAERIAHLNGEGGDPHYLGFFECFNSGEYYEAHDVLEELWLDCRNGPEDAFYKALIQLAGAFVHLRKERLKPAGKLFRLSRSYLSRYPRMHERLDLAVIIDLINCWLDRLDETDYAGNPLHSHAAPQIFLQADD